ncbi:TetR family transcriptional regulator [Acinetobacter rudis]|uniref:TetR family transcriptional regulator n=1 Tax=Acinetobacter rudis TaxID=632955 RepID=UPI0028105C61|nr:TetR family transcriptional regulator [Acinetobacter rudis]MDQ8951826.1 TetR family transcriptional regulator [Acinetobacter rudis]
MAWDTEGTKSKILEAAIQEFAKYGPNGTTIDKIAKLAKVNKERIYNYYGDKHKLFEHILQNELIKVAESLPIKSFATEDIIEYAENAYDYHRDHPALSRLLLWEGLTYENEVPNEVLRKKHYNYKVNAIIEGQKAGKITNTLDAEYIAFLVLSLANSWFTLPQMARMLSPIDRESDHTARKALIAEAVKRLIQVA